MPLVPTVKDFSFYSDSEKQKKRYGLVVETFAKTFHQKPDFLVRAPGRVNLMGDHIDYCHFSVLPMAIEVDVIAAVSKSDDNSVTIANTDEKFTTQTFDLPSDGSLVTIDKNQHSWGNYFKCGLLVAHKYITETYPEKTGSGKKPLKGLHALFDGTVPTGGGLSSSAAFCIAATLAVLKANDISDITKEDLTRITVVCEHYVGLSNGGMDQCASIYGEPSKVLLILFKPKLETTPFELPKTKPEAVFLISNSLVTSNKTETAPTNYNLRVVEVAVAADLLAHKLGLKTDQDSNLNTATLRGAFDAYFTQKLGEPHWDGKDINMGIERLTRILEYIETVFSDEEKKGFTTEEAAKATGKSKDEFSSTYLSAFPVRYDLLKIYQRTKHVFSDSLRVLQCIKVARDFKGNSEEYLQQFGKLMNESQVSCNILNNASPPKCEELCRIARENGAYGSRITGAAFGGSIVHLTTVDRLQKLIDVLTTEYYKKTYPNITETELNEAIVVSKPAEGACVVDILDKIE